MYDLGEALDAGDVPPGTNLLVFGPPLSGKSRLCYELLEVGLQQSEGGVVVTNTDSARRLEATYPSLFAYDAPLGVVDCITKHQGHGTISDTDLVQYAGSPEDMTGIGIKASRLLQELHDGRGLSQNRVLFHSVSTLLHYSTVQTVFRFLHVFTSRIESAGALGLFVVEAGAHDDQTVSTVRQLFDGVIRVEADGSRTVRLL